MIVGHRAKQTHLLLGGCGFIGSAVALELGRSGHRAVIAGRRPPTWTIPPELADNIEWRFAELSSVNWDHLVAGFDVIHHYAWDSIPSSANHDPGRDLLANVGATICMLDAITRRGDGRVVFASSGGTVYGKLTQIPAPETHVLAPINAYAAGKVAAETYLGLYRVMHGLDCRIARIANPYGPGQNLARGLGAVTTFIHHALNREPIMIWGDGNVTRDYIHIRDVAGFLALLAASPPRHEYIFNVGSGVGISLNGIVSELERQLARRLEVVRSAGRPIDVPENVLSIERAARSLGWSPAICFSEGVAMTIEDLGHNVPKVRMSAAPQFVDN